MQQASFEHKAESGGGAAASAPKQPRRGKAPAAATLTADEQTARIRAAEQKAALSWAEEGDESTGLRIIVLGNVFDPTELAAGGPGAADELAEEVAEEVARFGEVERMTLFSQHESGPIMVRGAGCVDAREMEPQPRCHLLGALPVFGGCCRCLGRVRQAMVWWAAARVPLLGRQDGL